MRLWVSSWLAAGCRGDTGASAAAVESLLDAMGELPPPDPASPGSSKDPLRRALLAACATASRVVEEVREAAEGLAGVGFAPGSSTALGGAADGRREQSLAARLRSDSRRGASRSSPAA